MGTPGYLSPEQCRDEDIDNRTDIYSLGVTLFEMLTGSIPFKADSPLALLRQILEVEPPDVRDLNPDVPEELRTILKKMMAKNRDERYSEADLLAQNLQTWLESRGVSTLGAAIPIAGGVPPSTVPSDPIHTEPTLQVPSGVAHGQATEATELMGPPSIPDLPAPEKTGLAESKVVGFVSQTSAPAIPAPPGFSPPAQAPDHASDPPGTNAVSAQHEAEQMKPGKRSPALLIAVPLLLLLLLTGGAFAAWKTGALDGVLSRLGLSAASAKEAAPPGKEQKKVGLADPENGDPEIREEKTPQIAAENLQPEDTHGAAGSAGAEGSRELSPSISATSASGSSEYGKTTGLKNQTASTEGPSSGDPGQAQAASAPAEYSGGNNYGTPAGSGTTPPSMIQQGKMQSAPVQAVPPPAQMGHGVALVSLGDPLLGGHVETFVQNALNKRGLDVFNGASIPGVMDSFSGDASGSNPVDLLRPHARWLVVLQSEYIGDRELQYMGRWELEYQGRISVEAFDLRQGNRVGQNIRCSLGYTQLSVERKVSEVLRSKFRPIAQLIGTIGN